MALLDEVQASLAAAGLPASDAGAAELAQLYALEIDADSTTLTRVGPLLLAALESLGLTARGRRVRPGTQPQPQPSARSVLDELRERRERRAAGS